MSSPMIPTAPIPSQGGHSCCFPFVAPMGPADQAAAEQYNSLLVYTGEPLPADLELIGDVSVTLYAASSAVDTDWTARLCQVDACGRSTNLQEGIRSRPFPRLAAGANPDRAGPGLPLRDSARAGRCADSRGAPPPRDHRQQRLSAVGPQSQHWRSPLRRRVDPSRRRYPNDPARCGAPVMRDPAGDAGVGGWWGRMVTRPRSLTRGSRGARGELPWTGALVGRRPERRNQASVPPYRQRECTEGVGALLAAPVGRRPTIGFMGHRVALRANGRCLPRPYAMSF